MRNRLKSILQKLFGINGLYYARLARNLMFEFIEFYGGVIVGIYKIVSRKNSHGKIIIDRLKRILVIRTDRIGDLVLSTSVLYNLRKIFPNAELSLLVREYTKDILDGHPGIDNVLHIRNGSNILEIIQFSYRLRRNKYDAIFVLYNSIIWGFISIIIGASIRVGYAENGGGFLMTETVPPPPEDSQIHEVERNLNLLKAVKIPVRTKELSINIAKNGLIFAEEFFNQNNFCENSRIVAIHPGSRQEYLRWPLQCFIDLTNGLLDYESIKILVIGNRYEKHLVFELLNKCNIPNRVVSAGDTSLIQLIALLHKCDLFIGNSTGPMHLAVAAKTPTVAIFGCTHPLDSPSRCGPWGEGNIVISPSFQWNGCHPSVCQSDFCSEVLMPKKF
jgi:heptosyltransferase-2